VSDTPFGSNQIRLSPREWVVALVVILALIHLVPVAWERVERFAAGPDHRIPYRLSSDYWTYGRWCRSAAAAEKTSVVGDSVVWGHYVDSGQTLSACLNKLGGGERFANLGVDGIHPAAMAGLVEHYGQAVAGRRVLLHCNLLWMSSKRHDLQTEKEFAFNHPTLVPQFFPRIPCYAEPLSGRIAIAIERRMAFHGWKKHLRVAYFQDADIPAWTVDHPYECPASAITFELPSPDEPPSPKPVAESWTKKGVAKFGPPWVDLATSFQWRSFRRTVEILRRRGNRVFVVLGPFNEHMLKDESRETYQEMKREVEAWLQGQRIPHYIPPPLPSDLYADASHPLAEGYALLAKQLLNDEAFARFNRSQ